METTKRFPFLITDGDVILVNPVWHDTEAEAKKHLAKTLSPIYSIIEDVQIISEFIEKEEIEMAADLPVNRHKLLDEYRKDLETIKKSLENKKEEVQMNIEKMKEFIQLKNELEDEGVYGFSFHECGFHVSQEKLVNEPNLQIESRGAGEYPYEIFVQHEGFKIYAIIKAEQLKNFPQFKEQVKAKLLEQLQYLEEDVILDGMKEGEEIA